VMIGISAVITLLIIAATGLSIHLKQRQQREGGGGGGEANADVRLQTINVEEAGKDVARRDEPRVPSLGEKMLLAFSLTDNWAHLAETHTHTGDITCLNGLRAISICWVLLGHVMLLIAGGIPLKDFAETLKVVGRFSFQLVVGAFYSVDTFFFLSGFLTAYVAVKHAAKRGGKINIALAIVHRWIRLSVLYAFVIGVWEFVTPFFGDGPRWPLFVTDLHASFLTGGKESACKQYWWANLLYINNFIPKKFGEICLPWTWYLANDFQFFVVGIIVLAIYCGYSKKIGWYLIGLLLLTCWIVTGTLDVVRDWQVAVLPILFEADQHQFYELYEKPWCRIAPYLIGMIGGLLILEHREAVRERLVGLTRYGRLVCHALAAGLMLFVVFIQYEANKSTAEPWSPTATFFYNAFSRSVWAVGLWWIVVCCATDMAPWTNKILSLPVFLPFARLTYAFYLIHLPIIAIWLFTRRDVDYYYDGLVAVYYPAFLVLGFSVATFFYLFVEAPFMNLDKLLLANLMRASDEGARIAKRKDESGGQASSAESLMDSSGATPPGRRAMRHNGEPHSTKTDERPTAALLSA